MREEVCCDLERMPLHFCFLGAPSHDEVVYRVFCDDDNVPAGLLSSPRNERLDKISDGAVLGRPLVALP